ncbi:MAG TPA: hypothetical protein PL131_13180 [Methylotenera sp.]|nr:hypothetical protein [Methylotenera sp.]
MIGLILSLIFMVVGIILIAFGIKRNKKVNVSASNGSIAVGGNNSGVMLNVGNNATPSNQSPSHGHGLTILGIIVELAAIGVTVWHALHLAAK